MNHRFATLALGASFVFGGALLTSCGSSAASPSAKATTADTCSLQRLSVTATAGAAAAGTEGMLLAFRNKGARTCNLQGYPEVVAVRPGASSTAKESESASGGGLAPGEVPSLISLKPGGFASVTVTAGDEPRVVSSPCVHQRYQTVVVSLPGQAGSETLSADLPEEATSLPSCSRVAVTPFLRGVTWGV